MRKSIRLGLLAVVVGGTSVAASSANAASIIRDPNPPQYKVEIEPHLNVQLFGWDYYRSNGFGPGVRFSIPIMSPGFVKKINDSVAISFGADFLYYTPAHSYCSGGGRFGPYTCYDAPSFWVLYAPVALQWNFWLTDKWSVFGEPGLTFRSDFGRCDVNYCGSNAFPLYFAFYAGARYHFSDTVALTMRAGFPTGLSVGVSIF